MTAPKNGPGWVKSSPSFANGNCVKVASLPGCDVAVRDSSKPDGAVLRFTVDEWHAFVGGVRNGEFDRFGAQPMRSHRASGSAVLPYHPVGQVRQDMTAGPRLPGPAGKALHALDMQRATKKQSSPADGRDSHDRDGLHHHLRGRRGHTPPYERRTVDPQAYRCRTRREVPAC